MKTARSSGAPIFWSVFAIFALMACSPSKNWQQNNLSPETSPYMEDFSSSPVWWQEWTPQTLAYAKKSQRLLLITIGYSACHWCQQMRREAFQWEGVIKVANESFVSVVIDKETQPDLDFFFRKAQQAITKKVAWPITLVLTPELTPIFASSVVPGDKLEYILKELQQAWINQREKLITRGKKVQEVIIKEAQSDIAKTFDRVFLQNYQNHLRSAFDGRFGGKRGSIKFPIFSELKTLLRNHHRNPSGESLKMVKNTLHNMLKGGVYDHLEGGLHRGSHDRQWLYPHFEKMLFDQAELIDVLFEVNKVAPSPFFSFFLNQMVNFITTRFYSEEGFFYASVDSESKPKAQKNENTDALVPPNPQTGLAYLWTKSEIQNTLGSEKAKTFFDTYGLTSGRPPLGLKGVLFRKTLHIKNIEDHRAQLLEQRRNRPHPREDKKSVTAWNAQALGVLYKLAREKTWRHLLPMLNRSLTRLLRLHRRPNGALARYVYKGKPYGTGMLNDYVFLAQALLEAYQTTGQQKHLVTGHQILQVILKHFAPTDRKGPFLYHPARHESFPYPSQILFQDSARPSGQSLLLSLLRKYSILLSKSELSQRGDQLEAAFPDHVEKFPHAFPSFTQTVQEKLGPLAALVTHGSEKDCQDTMDAFSSDFTPYLLFNCRRVGKKPFLPIQRFQSSDLGPLPHYSLCFSEHCWPATDQLKVYKNKWSSKN